MFFSCLMPVKPEGKVIHKSEDPYLKRNHLKAKFTCAEV